MPHEAYKIEGPALISFSGGRTSAYMLHEIIRAYGGTLPDDVRVCFANTGKEREETLTFVQACADRWNVHVHWLERGEDGNTIEVDYNRASRFGQPFAALIKKKSYTPNAVSRWCTVELKIRVMKLFAQKTWGWKHWTNVIGLRYDEGHRVLKAIDRSESGKEPWRNAMPLSKAKVTRRDVLAFWEKQPFDLNLKHHEGNCDLCFLKSKAKLQAIIRDDPRRANWWITQEVVGKGSFCTEYSYTTLLKQVRDQGHLFDGFLPEEEEHDAECGLICGSDHAAA